MALESLLTNCEINLLLTWWAICVPTDSTGTETFTITGTKTYVPVVTVDPDNTKLLQKLKSRLQVSAIYLVLVYNDWLSQCKCHVIKFVAK